MDPVEGDGVLFALNARLSIFRVSGNPDLRQTRHRHHHQIPFLGDLKYSKTEPLFMVFHGL
jgi:hypothetical protein